MKSFKFFSIAMVMIMAMSLSFVTESQAQYKAKQVFQNADSTFIFKAGWRKIPTVTQKSAVLDFASTATLTSTDLTITVTGATVGDPVSVGTPAAPNANTCYTAFVSAANTVTVRFNNFSGSTIDPASATFYVVVTRK